MSHQMTIHFTYRENTKEKKNLQSTYEIKYKMLTAMIKSSYHDWSLVSVI